MFQRTLKHITYYFTTIIEQIRQRKKLEMQQRAIVGLQQQTDKNAAVHYSDVIIGTMMSEITSLMFIYSTVYSGWEFKETSKLRVTGLCAGNSPVTGEFRAQMTSNAENVAIWYIHIYAAFQLNVWLDKKIYDQLLIVEKQWKGVRPIFVEHSLVCSVCRWQARGDPIPK